MRPWENRVTQLRKLWIELDFYTQAPIQACPHMLAHTNTQKRKNAKEKRSELIPKEGLMLFQTL